MLSVTVAPTVSVPIRAILKNKIEHLNNVHTFIEIATHKRTTIKLTTNPIFSATEKGASQARETAVVNPSQSFSLQSTPIISLKRVSFSLVTWFRLFSPTV